MHFLL
ncbi:hypothetical protein VCHC62B1_1158A, partial [Vibrio cholerae HC-62B1]